MKKGFTLIELLIVIAVLGILAAGILATIDPFEQFKKARDTNARNTVIDVYNGFLRFNAIYGVWPWQYSGTSDTCSSSSGYIVSSMGCISALINTGELKPGLAAALTTAGLTGIHMNYVTSTSEDTMAICFQPQSRAIRADPNSKWDVSGTSTPGGCPASSISTCYWCAK